jgi:hypothetical protein
MIFNNPAFKDTFINGSMIYSRWKEAYPNLPPMNSNFMANLY